MTKAPRGDALVIMIATSMVNPRCAQGFTIRVVLAADSRPAPFLSRS